jgi:hypothetical protein
MAAVSTILRPLPPTSGFQRNIHPATAQIRLLTVDAQLVREGLAAGIDREPGTHAVTIAIKRGIFQL